MIVCESRQCRLIVEFIGSRILKYSRLCSAWIDSELDVVYNSDLVCLVK